MIKNDQLPFPENSKSETTVFTTCVRIGDSVLFLNMRSKSVEKLRRKKNVTLYLVRILIMLHVTRAGQSCVELSKPSYFAVTFI